MNFVSMNSLLVPFFVLVLSGCSSSPPIMDQIDSDSEWEGIQDQLEREAELDKIRNQDAEDRLKEEIYEEIKEKD